MKFTTGFAINSLFRFCVGRLSGAGLGTIVLGLCVTFAYAQSDVPAARRGGERCKTNGRIFVAVLAHVKSAPSGRSVGRAV